MPAVVTKITPGRGRVGDTISLIGTGFSTVGGQNVVTVDGQAATVTLDTATQVDITVPGAIAVNRHVEVIIENLSDPGPFTWWWWSKELVANLEFERQ